MTATAQWQHHWSRADSVLCRKPLICWIMVLNVDVVSQNVKHSLAHLRKKLKWDCFKSIYQSCCCCFRRRRCLKRFYIFSFFSSTPWLISIKLDIFKEKLVLVKGQIRLKFEIIIRKGWKCVVNFKILLLKNHMVRYLQTLPFAFWNLSVSKSLIGVHTRNALKWFFRKIECLYFVKI